MSADLNSDSALPARSTAPTHLVAGLLLVAWIAVQVLIIRTLSFFHPTYLAIGLSFACVGRHLERLEHQGPADPEPGTIGPVAEPSASQTIGA
jgi:hypothetical protein